jgi:hypothetical protein
MRLCIVVKGEKSDNSRRKIDHIERDEAGGAKPAEFRCFAVNPDHPLRAFHASWVRFNEHLIRRDSLS